MLIETDRPLDRAISRGYAGNITVPPNEPEDLISRAVTTEVTV